MSQNSKKFHSVTVAMSYLKDDWREKAIHLAEILKIPCVRLDTKGYEFFLVFTEQGLELRMPYEESFNPIKVDFLGGGRDYRRRRGSGHGELLARSVRIKNRKQLTVLDATGGIGNDAFVLSSLGYHVTVCERSPIMASLLEDGIRRLKIREPQHPIQCVACDAKSYLKKLPQSEWPDVIYVDPMFPEDNRSALVKKEMRVLRKLVGCDEDSNELFECAIQHAKSKVIVKRHRYSLNINNAIPDLSFRGKSCRFDVYLKLQ